MKASGQAENLANAVGAVIIRLNSAEADLRTLACDLSICVRRNDTKERLTFYGLTSTRTDLQASIDELAAVLKKHSALFLAPPDADS